MIMKKILSYLLAMLLILAGSMSLSTVNAQAASSKTMYVKSSTTLKSSPKNSSKTLKKVQKNDSVTVYSTSSGSYSKAKFSGKTGWILKSKVSDSKKVRSTQKESIGYKTVKQNDSSLTKGTTKVSQNGKNGIKTKTVDKIYKNGKLISTKIVSSKVTKTPVNKIVKVGTKVTKTSTNQSKTLPTKNSKGNFIVYKATAPVIARETPNEKGRAIKTINKGEYIYLWKRESNGWYKMLVYKVGWNNDHYTVGYVNGKNMVQEKAEAWQSVPTYTTNRTTNLRSSDSGQAKSLATIKAGTKLTILNLPEKEFYKIKYNDKVGYVYKKDIKVTWKTTKLQSRKEGGFLGDFGTVPGTRTTVTSTEWGWIGGVGGNFWIG